MKNIICTIAIFFASTSMVFADGTYWNNLSHESKIVYMVGYRDGNNMGLSVAEYICKNKTEKELHDVTLQIKRQKVLADNIDSVVSGIDKFYSDYANQKLPMPVAIAVVISRLLGQPEANLLEYIEETRKEFNKP